MAKACGRPIWLSLSSVTPRQSSTTTILSRSTRWGFAAKRCPRSALWRVLPSRAATVRSRTPGWLKSTPARLKFLKTDRTEADAIREALRRLAMSRADVAFTLSGEERASLSLAAALPGAAGRLLRLGDVLGADFRANAIAILAAR